MVIKDVAFTAYPAKDVAALRDFYARTLGFTFTAPFAEDGVLKYDETQVGSAWFAVMTTEWIGETPAANIAFEVDDLEKALDDLRGAGVKTGEVHETPVCKLGSFTDPQGNTVTLHQTTVLH